MSSYEGAETGGGRVNRASRPTGQLDEVFEVLQDRRRRYLLYHLAEADDTVHSLEDVVEAVQEHETDEGAPPTRQSVRTSLVHGHLPRLADIGVLEHDPRRGTVQYHGPGPLEGWLEQARQVELD